MMEKTESASTNPITDLMLDNRFKRAVLEALYIFVSGEQTDPSYRKAVAGNIAMLIADMDDADMRLMAETKR